jgi:adenosine deaminase
MEAFIKSRPKTELHLHIEGTLEPEMVFSLPEKHGVALRFVTIKYLRDTYPF